MPLVLPSTTSSLRRSFLVTGNTNDQSLSSTRKCLEKGLMVSAMVLFVLYSLGQIRLFQEYADLPHHNIMSGLPLVANTFQEQQLLQQQRRRSQQQQQQQEQLPRFQIVFSTGCSTSQDWQSYVLFYHAWKSGQMDDTKTLTTITRVASGCTVEQEEALKEFHRDKIVRTMRVSSSSSSLEEKGDEKKSRFQLHFTPDFSQFQEPGGKKTEYKFFNKPLGLQHWMTHGLHYYHTTNHSNTANNTNQLDNVTFIILDPDQIILRPFLADSFEQEEGDNEGETRESRRRPSVLYHKPDQIIHRSVSIGKPMAQRYGMGAGWSVLLNAAEILGSPEAAAASPLSRWTVDDIRNFYVVGPPYLAKGRDMVRIVNTWAEVVGPVYRQTHDHLSEMFAYSVAAGHLGLRHQIVTSFMVSDVGANQGEGWQLLFPASSSSSSLLDSTAENDTNNNIDDYSISDIFSNSIPQQHLPHILHYCQRYHLGPWFFNKYTAPKTFLFDCQHPLFDEPDCCNHVPMLFGSENNLDAVTAMAANFSTTTAATTTIDEAYDWCMLGPKGEKKELNNKAHRRRNAFMLHHMLQKLNQAAIFYRQEHCQDVATMDGSGGVVVVVANYSKSYFFPHESAMLSVMRTMREKRTSSSNVQV